MKRILGTLLFLMIASSALAHPPSEIYLNYALEIKTLHIEIKHVSDSLREHHIRRLIVYRNDEEVQTLNFNTQKPPGLETDIIVETKPGDTLRVTAICSEAGNREQSLTIPEELPAETLTDAPVEKPVDASADTPTDAPVEK